MTDGDPPPADADSPALRLQGVRVAYDGVPALRGVDLSVEAGRLVGLVGPNGAGKTTLLHAVNGSLPADAGSVRLGPDDVSDLGARATARRAATVPQVTTLAFDFTVRAIVEMGRHAHRSRLRYRDPAPGLVDRALQWTGTAHLADRPISAVSGGERQRVLVARALAQDAPLLLLDEPTANLDVGHAVRVMGLVRELVDREGRTAVAAIHDLDLAARFCDELVLLADGRVRVRGDPASVLSHPAIDDAFDARTGVARHPITGAPTVAALGDGREPARDDDVDVHVLGGGGPGAAALARLDAAGVSVSTGPVAAGDLARETARALDLGTIVSDPFRPLDAATKRRVAGRLRAADVVVVAPTAATAGNEDALVIAAAHHRPVVLRDREEHTADLDDGIRRRYRRLIDRAVTVDESAVVDGVLTALGVGSKATPGRVRPPADGG